MLERHVDSSPWWYYGAALGLFVVAADDLSPARIWGWGLTCACSGGACVVIVLYPGSLEPAWGGWECAEKFRVRVVHRVFLAGTKRQYIGTFSSPPTPAQTLVRTKGPGTA